MDYLKTLPYVDMDRLGIMGWSHGGFITAHSLFRDDHPFKAGAAIVPVTNLIFRLSDHGPGYQDDYAAQPGIQGLPYENVDEYIRRSPVYHVQNLKVPILVHDVERNLQGASASAMARSEEVVRPSADAALKASGGSSVNSFAV